MVFFRDRRTRAAGALDAGRDAMAPPAEGVAIPRRATAAAARPPGIRMTGRSSRAPMHGPAFPRRWSSPWAGAAGRTRATRRTPESRDAHRGRPEGSAGLRAIASGGFAAVVIRMQVLPAGNRGPLRRDRLERSGRAPAEGQPFVPPGAPPGAPPRATIIHRQALIAACEPERANATPPRPDPGDRALAFRVLGYGPGAEMAAQTSARPSRVQAVPGGAEETGGAAGTGDRSEAPPPPGATLSPDARGAA